MNAIERSGTAGNDTPASPGPLDGASLIPPEVAALAAQFKLALAAHGGSGRPTARGSGDLVPPADASVDILPPLAGIGTPARTSVPTSVAGGLAGESAGLAEPTPRTSGNQVPSDTGKPVVRRAESDDSDRDATDRPSDTIGAAVLQSWLSQSPGAAAQPTRETQAPAPVRNLEALVADTVSRVLVSDPLRDNRREVRMEVSREVLPDTQVRLWREDGRLHVEFMSTPEVANAGLRDALPNLGEAIQRRQPEAEMPVVLLRVHSGDAAGQPGDGRSRQQYFRPADPEELA